MQITLPNLKHSFIFPIPVPVAVAVPDPVPDPVPDSGFPCFPYALRGHRCRTVSSYVYWKLVSDRMGSIRPAMLPVSEIFLQML